jgi:hypothetical protein
MRKRCKQYAVFHKYGSNYFGVNHAELVREMARVGIPEGLQLAIHLSPRHRQNAKLTRCCPPLFIGRRLVHMLGIVHWPRRLAILD